MRIALAFVLLLLALVTVASADASFPVFYHTMSGEWACTAVSTPGAPLSDGLADVTCEQPGWTFVFYGVHYGEQVGEWEGVYEP